MLAPQNTKWLAAINWLVTSWCVIYLASFRVDAPGTQRPRLYKAACQNRIARFFFSPFLLSFLFITSNTREKKKRKGITTFLNIQLHFKALTRNPNFTVESNRRSIIRLLCKTETLAHFRSKRNTSQINPHWRLQSSDRFNRVVLVSLSFFVSLC